MIPLQSSILAAIDVQERHFGAVYGGPRALDRMVRLTTAASILGVPRLWTEHVPRAFGPTLPALAEALAGVSPIEKRAFGCFLSPSFAAAVGESARHLVLIGSETHICIAQTAFQALERGITPILVADALGSRAAEDHERALARVSGAGGVVTTWEALVYEWMQTSEHPRFREILKLVKE